MDSYIIKLNATHSQLKIRLAEIRFDLRNTIRQVKEVLERKFGSSSDNMVLELRDSAEQFILQMVNDQETLAFYGPHQGQTIHVIDTDPNPLLSQLDDVSQVEKFKISEEEFAKKDGTFRKFKAQMVKKDPNFMNKNSTHIPDDFQKDEADIIQEGQRSELTIGQRRGEVKYVGKVPELAPGFWIGIQLDEPTGDSDGIVKGKKYFDVTGGAKFGIFVRPVDVKVGEFPPFNDFDEAEDVI